ncbi:hypothetical protein CEP54_012544 [Fusarium duplospermum]|uniref:Uncharacterized protein n=1 Tax=Fusarium duplospermum TaxID=1325734 RepID=A0A428P7Z3_9HYPO|nr:hypothetical protein CEP54_012544 [Fusarium duplospermum]
MTIASPCRGGRKNKVEPVSLPSDCGEDAYWDDEKNNCHCKGRGAKWNARKKRCDCINPDTEWYKDMQTCKCRSLQKGLNKKGECVCITDPMSLWFQDLGRYNDCPKPPYDPNRRYFGFTSVPGPKLKKMEEEKKKEEQKKEEKD